jgi:hypothetical protein
MEMLTLSLALKLLNYHLNTERIRLNLNASSVL